MEKIDYSKAVEIAKNVFWLGYNVKEEWFHTNAYLVVEEDEAVLIDPGSVIDFEKVYNKLISVCPIEKVKHIILHHQDPDLCGSTTEFEKLTNPTVYMAERSVVFAKYYGIKSFAAPISQDNESLEFKTGRKLSFFLTPYCHSPGAMVSYDEKNKILFSSDIFGAFNQNWELFADIIEYNEHLDSIKRFMEPYMASKEAVMNFVNKAEKLDIKMICPQHGSIIRKDVKKWLNELQKMSFGTALTEKKSGLEFSFGKK